MGERVCGCLEHDGLAEARPPSDIIVHFHKGTFNH